MAGKLSLDSLATRYMPFDSVILGMQVLDIVLVLRQ